MAQTQARERNLAITSNLRKIFLLLVLIGGGVLAVLWFNEAIHELPRRYYNHSPHVAEILRGLEREPKEQPRVPPALADLIERLAQDYIERTTGKKAVSTRVVYNEPAEEGSDWERFNVVITVADETKPSEKEIYYVNYLVDLKFRSGGEAFRIESIKFAKLHEQD
jgi:hypothetical protein